MGSHSATGIRSVVSVTMKISYVRMGVILFPLLLALMVSQAQGECDLPRVERCVISNAARVAEYVQARDIENGCRFYYKMVGCWSSCSEALKRYFNSGTSHASARRRCRGQGPFWP